MDFYYALFLHWSFPEVWYSEETYYRHLHQDPQVVELALPFMSLVGLSIIPMLLFMTLKQFTDGLEYTKTAMMLSLSAMPINIFLNWLLIYGHWGFPRLELVGAGYATLITRTVIFVVLAWIVLKHKTFRRFIAVSESQWRYSFNTIRELLRIGIPSSIQLGVEVCAFAVSGIIIGTISAVSQAAHQIALSCAAFTFMVSMGLSQAGSIRVSNAFGRSGLEQNTCDWKNNTDYRFVIRKFLRTYFYHFPVAAAVDF